MATRKNNSGALFKNTKGKSENSPYFNGSCTVGGEEYYLAAWVKENKGTKYLSLAFTLKEEKPDNDLPF